MMGAGRQIALWVRTKLSISWLLVLFFFAAFLISGLLIYRDYGLSWDEPTQLELGIKTYRFVVKQDPALLSFRDRYYGPFFELILMVFQADSPPQEIFFSRHLLNFLAFFCGCVGFFGLAKYLFKQNGLALLGCAFLVFSPRIFADAFYNSKDIPFLVFYLFSLFSLMLFIDRPNPLTAVLHGLMTASMLATRLPGLVIPILTVGALLHLRATERIDGKRALLLGLLYLSASAILMVCFWPALWPNPPAELLEAFRLMKNFPHLTGMLFFGQAVVSDNLPLFYIPGWIVVTTPPLYLVLFLAGLVWMAGKFIRKPKVFLTTNGLRAMILLASIVLPLAAVIALKSTLYDGWRQMYFIYPPMLLVGLWGLEGLMSKFSGRYFWQKTVIGLALLLVGFVPTAVWMVRSHPYQNVYFNRLAGVGLGAVQSRFPVDYWGLAYREGLSYLLQNDPSGAIYVFVESEAGMRSASIFPVGEQKRLHFVRDLKQATYYLGDFSRERSYPFHHLLYSVKVDHTPILAVFRLEEEDIY